MENTYQNDWNRPDAPAIQSSDVANAFLRKVFMIMAFGLAITGLVSYLFFSKLDANTFMSLYTGATRWILMFAPFAFILAINFGLHKMSYTTATLVFVGFAATMGLSLAWIFIVYDMGSIFQTFFITAGLFGLMALIGMTTKMDLTKMGSILYMAVIGLIVAMLVNFFMQSSAMHYLISGLGVVIFSGLTAYQTQTLLKIGYVADPNSEGTNKLALMGALNLYLSFINLFIFLLSLMGGRE